MGSKLDLTREYKGYYSAKLNPEIVEFNKISYLAIEGKGEPGGEEFQSKLEALYPLAYGVKKICKRDGKDFSVPKLEGLWWVDSDKPYREVPRKEWQWKLLIRMPDFVTQEIVEMAGEDVFKKRGIELIKRVRFERINEGKCIQVLHVGPYSTEPETLVKIRKFMSERNLVVNGSHHEIYLSDPRRVDEKRLKTILRQPVKEKT